MHSMRHRSSEPNEKLHLRAFSVAPTFGPNRIYVYCVGLLPAQQYLAWLPPVNQQFQHRNDSRLQSRAMIDSDDLDNSYHFDNKYHPISIILTALQRSFHNSFNTSLHWDGWAAISFFCYTLAFIKLSM